MSVIWSLQLRIETAAKYNEDVKSGFRGNGFERSGEEGMDL